MNIVTSAFPNFLLSMRWRLQLVDSEELKLVEAVKLLIACCNADVSNELYYSTNVVIKL